MRNGHRLSNDFTKGRNALQITTHAGILATFITFCRKPRPL